MPYTIITTTNSRRDIQAAIDWENERKPGLGEYFLKELHQKFNAISSTPFIWECSLRKCALLSY